MKQQELQGRKSAIKKIMQMVSQAMDKDATKDSEKTPEPKIAKVEVVKIKAKPLAKAPEPKVQEETSEWDDLPDEVQEKMENSDWDCEDCDDQSCSFCKAMA